MLVALPQSIAFGVVIYATLGSSYSAEGATAGMIGAVVLGILAPLIGGTRGLISNPCAPAAAIMAALASDLMRRYATEASPSEMAQQVFLMLLLAGLLAGLMQLLIGCAGGGRIMKYIPYPVVAGFLSGVALLIFIGQLPKLFGYPSDAGFWGGLASPSLWKVEGLVVGIVTMAGMLFGPRMTQAVPAPVIGLAAGVIAFFSLGLFRPELLTLSGNALVIGPIGGAQGLELASIAERWLSANRLGAADLMVILIPAMTLAVLLSIDTLKTCVIVDALTRTRSNSNRELVAQGIANFASALVGGLPGSGTVGATLVNISSGGKTRLSGVAEGIGVLITYVLLGRFVAWVPIPALAGILLIVAYRMIDRDSLHLLRQRSTVPDFGIVVAVAVVTVGLDLLTAETVGVGIAILLFLRDQIHRPVIRRKATGDCLFSKKRRLPAEMEVLHRRGSQTAVYELEGNLFFGTTDRLFSELEADLRTKTFVILDMRGVRSVDITAAHLLDQIEARLTERNAYLVFSALPHSLPTGQDLQTYFSQMGLTKPTKNVRIFDALDAALEWTEDRLLESEGLLAPLSEQRLELREIDLTRGLDAEDYKGLEACVGQVSFEASQRIFNQGDSGDQIFLIRRGTVRIMLPLTGGGRHHVATFSKGDFFGELAFLDRGLRSAEAIASSPTDLFSLSRERFDAIASQYPSTARRVLLRLARSLAIRLRQADSEIQGLASY
jgi:SulP family sulfate permease